MKKPWELQRELLCSVEPCYQADDNETIWEENASGPENLQDIFTKLYWHSQVPGSRAPESICLAYLQAMENRGYNCEGGMELVERGYKAYEEDDIVELHKLMYDIFRLADNAPKDEKSDYWKQTFYDSFEEYAKAVRFPEVADVDMGEQLVNKLHAGWLGQIIGGAYGTCIEGYTGENIRKKYGKVDRYIRKPNTYNDDITYELALLLAYKEHGKKTTALDIAREWISRIPTGWSAEDMALRNLKAGILPPESGRYHNAFNEWIGAQMRGAIAGQLYPGNVYEAARCAWMDASISHDRNGILGEVFNAVMTSMAFYEKDIRKIVRDAIELMPEDSEYGQVVRFAWQQCETHDNYYDAWMPCELKYQKYNWIHAYPNAAAEVVALYFGNGDFTETLACCGGCGMDVDCNAAQISTIVATINGIDGIDEYWKKPIGDELDTYVRGLKKMSIRALAEMTAEVARSLKKD
ncbi:MAG: ADP-ribosylglycohydrolase family protein [Erysipelotrichaceae bacterium]|nr:ADP-ribosylglycohydrolase family protein [Erysipelotrichaceae bacterium]